jgi:PKD repeat protein
MKISSLTSPLLLVALTLTIAGSARTTSAVDRPAALEPVVSIIQKDANPVSSSTREYFAKRGGELIKVWLFFTDKGITDQAGFNQLAGEVQISDKVLKRREKVDRDRVVFADLPVYSSYIEEMLDRGATLRRTSRWLNAASFEIAANRLDEYAALPFVARIKPMFGFKRFEPEISEIDQSLPDAARSQSAETLDYGSSLNQLQQIGVPTVHQEGYHGEGVTLAIFDTGYRKSHEAFAAHYAEGRVLGEWDFINDDGNTANEGSDLSSQWNHGTLIWSVSGGLKDGQIYGPAYKANFLLAKTEDLKSETPVEEDNWVAALEWADSAGADVITSSLGYIDWYTYDSLDGQTATITIAANMAAGMGIVLCNSMGNSGPSSGSLIAPADAFDMLAVGAVTANGLLASFSSRGPTFDGRMKPEVCAKGVSTFAASTSSNSSYTTASGTSLSTPLVAGCAAVMIGARPTFPPLLIREALMLTASQATAPDNSYGWGIIDVSQAINYAVGFTVDTTFGAGSLAVQFTDSSSLPPLSWHWDFGDGNESFDQNPAHTYTAAGMYDVSLTIETSDYGSISNSKAALVTLVDDDLTFVSDSALAGSQLVMSVMLNNTIDLDRIVVPFKIDLSPIDVTFDSAQLGARTDYFELLSPVSVDEPARRYTFELIADNGGGAPPLPPGSGEILKLFLTLDSFSIGGLANVVDSGHNDIYVPEAISPVYTYQLEVNTGQVSTGWIIRGDFDYNQSPIFDLSDLGYMVGFLFDTPPLYPVTIQSGDWNGDLQIDLEDLGLFVDFLFIMGDPPIQP